MIHFIVEGLSPFENDDIGHRFYIELNPGVFFEPIQ